MALSKGWNPLRGPIEGDIAETALLVGYSEKGDGSTAELHIDHFAKGPWYLAAALVNAGATWEQAKAFNLVLAVAAALSAFAAFDAFTQWTQFRAAFTAVARGAQSGHHLPGF